jgi:hypothetical protein
MTELAPQFVAFPDPEEVLRGAIDRIKQFFSPAEIPTIEAYEPTVVLDGLRAAKDDKPVERKVTHIDPENPEDVKKRDGVTPDTGRHSRGGRSVAADGTTTKKSGTRQNNRDSKK